MTPRLRPTLPLRFAEDLLPTDFERLCCELAAKEPHIDTAALYGRLPQGQKGVDILMFHRSGGAADVLQCKNYRNFTKANLKKALNEFDAARAHWHNKGVCRFLLCIGCTSSDTELQDEILSQRRRLSKRNIALDVWDDAELTRKLASDPDVTFRHCGQAVVDQICPQIASLPGAGKANFNLLQTTLEEYGAEFDQTVGKELPRIRELARLGEFDRAFDAVEELRASPRWRLLDASARARGLELAASLHLDHKHDVAAARRLMEEGCRLGVADVFQTIEAAILYFEKGSEAALLSVEHPTDVGAWNFRLALLVEAGRCKEVTEAVDREDLPPNGGSLRLASIAALLMRDLQRAQKYSDRAIASAPTWFQVRFQAARLKYLSTLLPHFPALTHIAWPIPPDLEYVRRDESSVARLQEASEEFRALAQVSSGEQRAVETWHLACIANLPGRHDEATQLAASLLARFPDHLSIAVWCLQRNFPVEKEAALGAFAPSADRISTDAAQALCQVHIRAGDFESAIREIDSARSAFVSKGIEFAWRHLRAQLAAALDQMDEAAKYIEEEPEIRHRYAAEVAVARVHARRTGDPAPLAKATRQAYAATLEVEYLFEAAESALEAGDLEFVVSRTEELLKHFPTAAALELVLHAHFAAPHHELFLRLWKSHGGMFEKDSIPMWLRRAEIECLWQIGQLVASLKRAEALVEEYLDTNNLFSLLGAQVAIADLRGGVQTARRLISRPDVSVAGLLHLSQALYVEDGNLARELLQKAIERGPAGNEIAAAVYLGFQLGAESLVTPLMRDFVALANLPGAAVQALPFPEVRELLQHNAKHRDHVWRMFGEGQVPVHAFAKAINVPLAILLHGQMQQARKSEHLWRDPPTLIRSGSKPTSSDTRLGTGELFMDITALLVAADLEILETIEKAFAPIFISASLIDSLRQQIGSVAPNQPGRKAIRDEILSLEEKKRLLSVDLPAASSEVLQQYASTLGDRWCAALTHVRTGNAWLCDFTPLRDFDGSPVTLAPDDAQLVVSPADVLHGLHRAGAIGDEERDLLLPRLGEIRHRFQPAFVLNPDSTLLLDWGIAEVLTEAGLLEIAASFTTVEVSKVELAEIRQENSNHEERVRLGTWVKTLTERIQAGLSTGTYSTVGRVQTPADARDEGPEEKCLRDLLSARSSGAKAVWCDDRWLSRYQQVDGLPNLGVVDVLRILRVSSRLSASGYFDILLRLRASNARYIPLEVDEIIHHLLRAPFSALGLRETPALGTIRRYAATCSLDRFRLHPPAKDEKGHFVLAEFQFALDNQRAVAEALTELWKADLAEGDRHTRAEWIVDELLVPMPGFIEAHSGLSQPNLLEGIAAELAVLFVRSIALPTASKLSRERSSPRAQFYRWIGERLFDPADRVEPRVIEKLAAHLVRDFVKRDGRLTSENERGLRGFTLRWILDLPDSVAHALQIPGVTRKWLGVSRRTRQLGFLGKIFDSGEFWHAVLMAVNGTAASVLAEDGEEYRFRPSPSGSPRYRVPVEGPGLGSGVRLADSLLPALVGTLARRKAFLQMHVDWFDMAGERHQPLLRKILRANGPADCVDLIETHRDRSAEHFYRNLFRQHKRNRANTTDDHLPPSAETLCNHLRLLDEPDFPERASRLIREVGLASAIERLASLPITLPEPILKAVGACSQAKRRALINRLRRRMPTPLGRICLIHLLGISAIEEPAYLEDAKTMVGKVLDIGEPRQQWKTLGVLLEWTRRYFLTLHDFRRHDVRTLLTLIWLHAGRLHQSIEQRKADPTLVQAAFSNAMNAFGMVPDHSRSGFWQDAAHPKRAGRLALAVRGLGAVLGELPVAIADVLRERVCAAMSTAEQFTSSTALLLRETSALPNSLNSYLGGDGAVLQTHAFGAHTLSQLLPHSPSQLILNAISELTESPEQMDAWHTLQFSAAEHVLPSQLSDALNSLFLGIDHPTLERILRANDAKLLPFLAFRSIVGSMGPLGEFCEEHILLRAREIAGSSLDEKARSERVVLLAGSLMILGIVPGDEAATHERTHKLLVRMLQIWPAAAASLRHHFSGWPTHLPVARQRGYWELEMTLRAMR